MAEVKVLLEGYLMKDSPSGRGSCCTISLIRAGDIVMVVDPGTVVDQKLIVDALLKEGLEVSDVTHVGITHGHMDHYRNIGMFADAISVDYDGIWTKDECVYSNKDEVVEIGDGLKTVKTPGHSHDSITFLVETSRGLVAVCGDVYWKKDYPEEDVFARDKGKLNESRVRVLEMADFIVPGHGGEYKA